MRHSAADFALLGELRAVLDLLDPVPEHIYHAAYAANKPIPGERLVSRVDSVAAELVGMRGTGDRVLRFGNADVSVQLMLCPNDFGGLRILGVLAPAEAEQVIACWPDGSARSEVEEHGRFLFSSVPNGPLRLEIDRVASTEWFLG